MLLDDFRADWFKFGYLLRLLDIYPMPLEYKGGMTHLCSQTIYITCPVHPEVLYANLISAKEGAKALPGTGLLLLMRKLISNVPMRLLQPKIFAVANL